MQRPSCVCTYRTTNAICKMRDCRAGKRFNVEQVLVKVRSRQLLKPPRQTAQAHYCPPDSCIRNNFAACPRFAPQSHMLVLSLSLSLFFRDREGEKEKCGDLAACTRITPPGCICSCGPILFLSPPLSLFL